MNTKEIRSRIKQLEMYLADEAREDLIQDYEVRMIHDEINTLKVKLRNPDNKNNNAAALTD